MLLESACHPSIQLAPGDTRTIGRGDATADVVVDEPSLSRLHARVRMAADGAVTIEDLGSTNGVFVNGTRHGVARVTAGDTVRLGTIEYRVASGDPTAIEALLLTSREVMACDDLQGLLDRVLDRVRTILMPDRSAILLIDRATGALRPRSVRPPGAYGTVSEFASSTAVRESLASREVLVVADASADARLRDAVSVMSYGVRSTVCVPLLGRSGPISALYADRTELRQAFAPEQIDAPRRLRRTPPRRSKRRSCRRSRAAFPADARDARESHRRARSLHGGPLGARHRVCTLVLARTMKLPDADVDVLRRAGMLHDIGKVGVPDRVLLKAGPLDVDERVIIESHVTIGFEMLRELPFVRDALPAIRGHHERVDGRGYPDKLGGDGIHLHARIMAVADSFDAMTSARPYRNALPLDEAARRVRADTGTQFDATVVQAFDRAEAELRAMINT